MKIIISPTKEMKATNISLEMKDILYKKENKQLHTLLKQYSIEEIHDRYNISFALAKKVYSYFHEKQPLYPAITLYSGTVFKKLSLLTYNDDDFLYLNDYLRICSSYYGILRPYDGIMRYRLDMLTKLDINLYDFWNKQVNKYFQDEDIIINLASNEFSKMLTHDNMITIDFIEIRAQKITRNAMHIKQARGNFLNHMVKHKIVTLNDIKNIIIDEYVYDETMSSNSTYVFKRNFIAKK